MRTLSPREEAATFRLADPRLTIELVAAEPQVASPVAIAWDADGALYVAEMIDYPVAPAAGRIRRLEDRDGDGIFERATVFADGLAFPNGVLPCFGGVLVTAAPDILFFRDTDGDGRADERRVVLTGFGQGNTQLRVNGLYWGLDNAIYAANGRSDGEIRTPESPRERAVSIRRRDLRFRFRPETGAVDVEAIAGFSQFGLAHDDWGNRFPSWNTIPVRHVVLEQSALDRNRFLAETSSIAQILDEADGGRVYSISPVQARFNRESVDYFNASCGPTIFRGDRLPSAYLGNAFMCEPLSNLVHRRVLDPDGCTFRARRVEPKQEFLASTDPAFRPVNLTTGPDGALYVVDMYRELVEHPDFVPKELRSTIEFRRWHDRGRIWRVRTTELPESESRVVRQPRLSRSSLEELVKLLEHPVGWYRDTAQRLLVERKDPQAIPRLQELLRTAHAPVSRLHALWTLAGSGGLDAACLQRAAADADPAVRENAIRAAASDRSRPECLPLAAIVALSRDPSIRVRLQAAIELGNRGKEGPQVVSALVTLAGRDAADPWVSLAILSGLAETSLPFLREWMTGDSKLQETASVDQLRLLSETGAILGARHKDDELRSLIDLVSAGIATEDAKPRGRACRLALLAGLGEGMERSGSSLADWLADLNKRESKTVNALEPLWSSARGLVLSDQPIEVRRLALGALVQGAPELTATLIPRLLEADQPLILQAAAARATGRLAGVKLTADLLDRWGELSLAVRRELLAALMSSPARAAMLITALEERKVSPVELDAAGREALLRLADSALRNRAAAILAAAAPADRSSVITRYQGSLRLAGEAARGGALFAKNCQTCHQHQGQGHRVGPDLSGIAGRLPAVLLSDILDPNRDVAPDQLAITVATKNGQVVSGLLVEETGTSLKLRKAEGIEETILRSQLAEVRSSGRSLMPEGLEQSLNAQEMADLIAFLRAGLPSGK